MEGGDCSIERGPREAFIGWRRQLDGGHNWNKYGNSPTILSYLFIVLSLVVCNHNIDLFILAILGHFGSLMAKCH